jgi:YidC/Oxa1 family membrane protein insertase
MPTAATCVGCNYCPYRDRDRNRFHPVADDPTQPYLAQSGLVGKGLPTHAAHSAQSGTYRLRGGAARSLEYRWWNDSPSACVEKTYIFKRGSYQITVRTRVINGGTQPIDLTPYYQFTRHGEAPRGSSFFLPTYTGAAFYTDAKKFQKVAFKDIQEGKAEFEKTADNGWVGMVQHHFVSAWLPEGRVKREYYTRALGDGLYSAGVIVAEGILAPGQQKTFTVPYAGPNPVVIEKLVGLNRRDHGWSRRWRTHFLVAGTERPATIIIPTLRRLYPLSMAASRWPR